MTGADGDRLAALEEQLKTLAWLHAELAYQNLRLAQAVAGLMAQRLAPQIQDKILTSLRGG